MIALAAENIGHVKSVGQMTGVDTDPLMGHALAADGAAIVLYGLVGVLGVRIWLTNHVDFSLPVNQMTAAIALIIGIADFTWKIGDLTFTGIALGSIAALRVYHGMHLLRVIRGRHPEAVPRGDVVG